MNPVKIAQLREQLRLAQQLKEAQKLHKSGNIGKGGNENLINSLGMGNGLLAGKNSIISAANLATS